MKRADLYRNRGTRPKCISDLRMRRINTEQNSNAGRLLPMCHWIQLCLCGIVIFLMLLIPSLLSNKTLTEVHTHLQHKITYTTDLEHREWRGSLKEFLFTEK